MRKLLQEIAIQHGIVCTAIVWTMIGVVLTTSATPATPAFAEPMPPTEQSLISLMEIKVTPGGRAPVLTRVAFNGWLILLPDGGDMWIPGLTCVDVAYGAMQSRFHTTQIEQHPQHERVQISDWDVWWGFQATVYWGACPPPAGAPPAVGVAAAPAVVTSQGPTVTCPLGTDFFLGRFPGTVAQQWARLLPPNGAQFNGQPLSFDVTSDLIVDFGSQRFWGSGRVNNASSFSVYSTACEP